MNKLELLRIIRRSTERMLLATEILLSETEKLHTFIDFQYELELKKYYQSYPRHKKQRLGSHSFRKPKP